MSANLVAPTAAWESKVGPTNIPLVGGVVEDPAGGWMIDTDTAAPDGYIVTDPSGGVMVDDAAVGGLSTRIINNVPLVY